MKMTRFQTPRYINTMILQPLVPRVGKHNIEKVRRIEKMGRVTGVESIERGREVEEAI